MYCFLYKNVKVYILYETMLWLNSAPCGGRWNYRVSGTTDTLNKYVKYHKDCNDTTTVVGSVFVWIVKNRKSININNHEFIIILKRKQ